MQRIPYLNLWEAIGLLAFGATDDAAGETWREREIVAGRKRAEVEDDEAVRVLSALDALHAAALDTSLTVLGRRVRDPVHHQIPATDWLTLEIDPIGGPAGCGSASLATLPEDEMPPGFPPKPGRTMPPWIDLQFRRVEVEKLPPVALNDRTLRCVTLLRKRRVEQGYELQKALQPIAQNAISGLTTREFAKAYKIVYRRVVGRPRETPHR